ncbi:phosphotransferase [Paucisalibacillus sp. EB02]|uniref:phosphotransferase n=1 Tax=Paucisalibacillus sp. EB02 TaxID=1347087 RepID=UPI0004BBF102|nr:phosphotransferase [Paucisalibacillus sp. EB02]
MENVRRVLESYQVYPIDINKVTSRVYHVKGNKQQSYALKKGSIQDKSLPFWLEIYRIAQTQNLQNILPVYLNQSGNLYSMDGNDVYYLTPWIESHNRNHSIEKIYQNLGLIHAKTRKVQSLSNEMRESSRENFLVYKKKVGELRKKLLNHVEQFEAQHFMSPVELLVCTQYRDLVQVFYVLERRLNQYLESLEDITEWKVSLCHGKLKDSHVLHGNQLYFINWEHATYQHPIMDLAMIIKDKTLYFDTDKRLLLDKLKVYTEENILENHELTLLAIYLLDPERYLQTIDNYVNKNSEDNTIDYVIKLQRYHRQVLFGVHFSEFVEEEFEMVSLDESGSES